MKQLTFLVAGPAAVLVLAGQLARAAVLNAAVPNDSNPYWSWDARTVAFQHEAVPGATRSRPVAATTASRHATASAT